MNSLNAMASATAEDTKIIYVSCVDVATTKKKTIDIVQARFGEQNGRIRADRNPARLRCGQLRQKPDDGLSPRIADASVVKCVVQAVVINLIVEIADIRNDNGIGVIVERSDTRPFVVARP